MKSTKSPLFLKIIIFLSIMGLLISIYLTQNHFAPPSQGALCDFGETLSCSLVNTSVYSELWNVPVALLGAFWFIITFFLAWNALKKEIYISLIFGWSILGFLSVIYFVIAEIILKALCLFCTVVHIIIILILILSLILYKGQKVKSLSTQIRKTFLLWIIFVMVTTLILFLYFNLSSSKENYDHLTKCLTEKGVVFYGSFRCGVCAKTKAMLGDSFQHIKEIECHPQGPNAQTELCIQKQIKGTPTWILEPNGIEIKRHLGFLSAEELKLFGGC